MKLKKCFGTVALHAKSLALITVLLILGGCASNNAPIGRLVPPEKAQEGVLGAWVEVTLNADEQSGESVKISGEFIAYDSSKSTIYLLSEMNLTEISLSDIKKAKLTFADSKSGELADWTAAGAVSTLTHGVFLLATAPLWIIVGSASTASQSHTAQETYPTVSWNDLRKYARFPQGLPIGFTG